MHIDTSKFILPSVIVVVGGAMVVGKLNELISQTDYYFYYLVILSSKTYGFEDKMTKY